MALSHVQEQLLRLLRERQGMTTDDLLAALGVSRRELAFAVEDLGERGLVFARVASISTGGWWFVTAAGLDALRSNERQ